MKKDLTRQQYLDLYFFMRLNRAVEDMMVKLFRQNKIVGGLYSSLGQEAVSVGTAYALEKKDWLAPMIRNIGALLVKGVPPRDVFMQHMAKYDSPTKGKDGTSHFGDLENLHIVSPISMLGDLIPVMTGVAMATPVITGIRSPSMEIGETMCRFSRSPKWLVPSLPLVGESYLAMCCMKTSRGGTPLTNSAPILRIIGASQSFFSSAYAVPTETASWPKLEYSPPTILFWRNSLTIMSSTARFSRIK